LKFSSSSFRLSGHLSLAKSLHFSVFSPPCRSTHVLLPVSSIRHLMLPVDNAVDNPPKYALFTDFLWISGLGGSFPTRYSAEAPAGNAVCLLFLRFSTGFSTTKPPLLQRSLAYPQEANEKPPRISLNCPSRSYSKFARTINSPDERTIVRMKDLWLVYGIWAFAVSPSGRKRSLDCSDHESIMLVVSRGGSLVRSHYIRLGICDLQLEIGTVLY